MSLIENGLQMDGIDNLRVVFPALSINHHSPVSYNAIELIMYLGTRGFDRKITARLRVVAPCTT